MSNLLEAFPPEPVLKKPLFFAAIFFAAGIAAHAFSPWNVPAALAAAGLTAALFSKDISRKVLVVLTVLVLAGAGRLALSDLVRGDDLLLKTKEYENFRYLGGRIVSAVETRAAAYGRENVSFVLQAGRVWGAGGKGQAVSGGVKVYLADPRESLAYGDELVLSGDLAAPKGRRNPGGFDSKAFLERQGIRTLFFARPNAKIKILGRGRGHFLVARIQEARNFLSRSLAREFSGNDAGFLQALFFGEREDLEEDFKDLFVKTGTLHLLAVSGFNIGFLVAVVLIFLGPLPLAKGARLWTVLGCVWLYCLLVGWQAPVVRASVMASIFLLGRITGRKTEVLNTLGLAALVILAVNPGQLFDVGFVLSFLSVFAIARFLPAFVSRPALLPNEKLSWKEKAAFYFRELFWVSFVCSAATLPVSVQNFYLVTPLSVIANLAVVPISFLLFFAGVVYFLTFWWVPAFLGVVPFLIKCLMRCFVASLAAVAKLPGAWWVTGSLNGFLLSSLAAGIFYLLWTRRFEKGYIRAAAVALFSLSIFLAQDILRQFRGGLSLTALDVGQGDSIYLEFPGGGNMLVDAGKGVTSDKGRWVLTPFLRSRGVRHLDALVISHPQEDHLGGMPTVLDEFKVKNLVETGFPYPGRFYKIIQEKILRGKSARLLVRRGQRLEGYRDVEIRILHPPDRKRPSADINDDSVVMKIVYGRTSFLLTGDITEEAMREILFRRFDLRSQVLKVPHHGGRLDFFGEAFVRQADPHVSLVSVGEKNSYGHPSSHTLDVLNNIPANRVFRSDQDFAVRVVSNGRSFTVQSLRESSQG
ncbi:MAG: DNA internalization-related competence protein ComEC/Rec2 [Candidatus Omnitrophica bacterium]|nr:DNA internalization-related competence protein ComEC/Rec2 [Candidatus Omnitrophota bacterium]